LGAPASFSTAANKKRKRDMNRSIIFKNKKKKQNKRDIDGIPLAAFNSVCIKSRHERDFGEEGFEGILDSPLSKTWVNSPSETPSLKMIIFLGNFLTRLFFFHFSSNSVSKVRNSWIGFFS
jgi:hypothetical protein